MLNRIILIAVLLTPLPAVARTPIAEVICAPRDELVQRLTVQYRSHLASMGLRDRESVMEIWTDAQGRWTLVQRNANGQSCILAMGADWMALENPA